MLRVLQFEPDLRENGAIKVMLDRADRWRQAGVDVRVILAKRLSEEIDQVTPPAGLDVDFAFRPGRTRYRALGGIARLGRLARSSDIILAGREIDSGLLLGHRVASIARRPFTATVHMHFEDALREWVPERQQGRTRRALRSVDHAVLVADTLRRDLVRLGIPADRQVVVPNGVDYESLVIAAKEGSPIESDGRPTVVAVGRLARQKGFDVLLAAHRLALDGGHAHRVLIVGDGPDRHMLERLAADLGIEASVTFLGFQRNPFPILAAADVFVLSSRQEGHPLSLIEALLLGVPAVATDCTTAVRRMLTHPARGEVVAVEDPDALAAGLVRRLTGAAAYVDGPRAPLIDPSEVDPEASARAHLGTLLPVVQRQHRDWGW